MKFTAFNGSPVGEKSAAGRMLGVFLAGAARAGYEFAAQGEVTAEPRTQLDAPLMSAAEYVQFLGM